MTSKQETMQSFTELLQINRAQFNKNISDMIKKNYASGEVDRVFNELPDYSGIDSVVANYLLALSTDQLELWHRYAIAQASKDLFDEHGEIQQGIKELFKNAGVDESQFTKQEFKKELIKSYITNIFGPKFFPICQKVTQEFWETASELTDEEIEKKSPNKIDAAAFQKVFGEIENIDADFIKTFQQATKKNFKFISVQKIVELILEGKSINALLENWDLQNLYTLRGELDTKLKELENDNPKVVKKISLVKQAIIIVDKPIKKNEALKFFEKSFDLILTTENGDFPEAYYKYMPMVAAEKIEQLIERLKAKLEELNDEQSGLEANEAQLLLKLQMTEGNKEEYPNLEVEIQEIQKLISENKKVIERINSELPFLNTLITTNTQKYEVADVEGVKAKSSNKNVTFKLSLDPKDLLLQSLELNKQVLEDLDVTKLLDLKQKIKETLAFRDSETEKEQIENGEKLLSYIDERVQNLANENLIALHNNTTLLEEITTLNAEQLRSLEKNTKDALSFMHIEDKTEKKQILKKTDEVLKQISVLEAEAVAKGITNLTFEKVVSNEELSAFKNFFEVEGDKKKEKLRQKVLGDHIVGLKSDLAKIDKQSNPQQAYAELVAKYDLPTTYQHYSPENVQALQKRIHENTSKIFEALAPQANKLTGPFGKGFFSRINAYRKKHPIKFWLMTAGIGLGIAAVATGIAIATGGIGLLAAAGTVAGVAAGTGTFTTLLAAGSTAAMAIGSTVLIGGVAGAAIGTIALAKKSYQLSWAQAENVFDTKLEATAAKLKVEAATKQDESVARATSGKAVEMAVFKTRPVSSLLDNAKEKFEKFKAEIETTESLEGLEIIKNKLATYKDMYESVAASAKALDASDEYKAYAKQYGVYVVELEAFVREQRNNIMASQYDFEPAPVSPDTSVTPEVSPTVETAVVHASAREATVISSIATVQTTPNIDSQVDAVVSTAVFHTPAQEATVTSSVAKVQTASTDLASSQPVINKIKTDQFDLLHQALTGHPQYGEAVTALYQKHADFVRQIESNPLNKIKIPAAELAQVSTAAEAMFSELAAIQQKVQLNAKQQTELDLNISVLRHYAEDFSQRIQKMDEFLEDVCAKQEVFAKDNVEAKQLASVARTQFAKLKTLLQNKSSIYLDTLTAEELADISKAIEAIRSVVQAVASLDSQYQKISAFVNECKAILDSNTQDARAAVQARIPELANYLASPNENRAALITLLEKQVLQKNELKTASDNQAQYAGFLQEAYATLSNGIKLIEKQPKPLKSFFELLNDLDDKHKILFQDNKLQIVPTSTLGLGTQGVSKETVAAFSQFLDVIEQETNNDLFAARDLLHQLRATQWGQAVLKNNPDVYQRMVSIEKKQMMLVSQEIDAITYTDFINIKESELNDTSGYGKRCPTLSSETANLNKVSNQVLSDILKDSNLDGCVQRCAFWIDIAFQLREQRNFSGMQYILSAIENTAIRLLLFVYQKNNGAELELPNSVMMRSLPKELQGRLNSLRDLVSIDEDFKKFHAAMEDNSGPTVPYLGRYRTALTFANDKNKLDEKAEILATVMAMQASWATVEKKQVVQTNFLDSIVRISEERADEINKAIVKREERETAKASSVLLKLNKIHAIHQNAQRSEFDLIKENNIVITPDLEDENVPEMPTDDEVPIIDEPALQLPQKEEPDKFINVILSEIHEKFMALDKQQRFPARLLASMTKLVTKTEPLTLEQFVELLAKFEKYQPQIAELGRNSKVDEINFCLEGCINYFAAQLSKDVKDLDKLVARETSDQEEKIQSVLAALAQLNQLIANKPALQEQQEKLQALQEQFKKLETIVTAKNNAAVRIVLPQKEATAPLAKQQQAVRTISDAIIATPVAPYIEDKTANGSLIRPNNANGLNYSVTAQNCYEYKRPANYLSQLSAGEKSTAKKRGYSDDEKKIIEHMVTNVVNRILVTGEMRFDVTGETALCKKAAVHILARCKDAEIFINGDKAPYKPGFARAQEIKEKRESFVKAGFNSEELNTLRENISEPTTDRPKFGSAA